VESPSRCAVRVWQRKFAISSGHLQEVAIWILEHTVWISKPIPPCWSIALQWVAVGCSGLQCVRSSNLQVDNLLIMTKLSLWILKLLTTRGSICVRPVRNRICKFESSHLNIWFDERRNFWREIRWIQQSGALDIRFCVRFGITLSSLWNLMCWLDLKKLQMSRDVSFRFLLPPKNALWSLAWPQLYFLV